jgi:hypothetical protein
MDSATESQASDPSFAVHTAINLGLDFKVGENFARGNSQVLFII